MRCGQRMNSHARSRTIAGSRDSGEPRSPQSEVVRGETAAVALPPAAAVKARVSRFFNEAQALNSDRDLRGEVG